MFEIEFLNLLKAIRKMQFEQTDFCPNSFRKVLKILYKNIK